jgi:hypothetical protein
MRRLPRLEDGIEGAGTRLSTSGRSWCPFGSARCHRDDSNSRRRVTRSLSEGVAESSVLSRLACSSDLDAGEQSQLELLSCVLVTHQMAVKQSLFRPSSAASLGSIRVLTSLDYRLNRLGVSPLVLRVRTRRRSQAAHRGRLALGLPTPVDRDSGIVTVSHNSKAVGRACAVQDGGGAGRDASCRGRGRYVMGER